MRSTLNGIRQLTDATHRPAQRVALNANVIFLAKIQFNLKEMRHEKEVQRLLNSFEEKL